MSEEAELSIVIVGGGASVRFGGGNKLLWQLEEKPLFLHSIGAFAPVVKAGRLVFVAPEAEVENFQQLTRRFLPGVELRWAIGGTTRSESVQNGLAALPEISGWVGIHDAARPLAGAQLLTLLVDHARKHGSAVPGKPVTDTLQRTDETGTILDTVSRENLWRVETPQLFELPLLREAYRLAAGKSFTDDAAVMRSAGFPVSICHNPSPNPKLTYRSECSSLAQAML